MKKTEAMYFPADTACSVLLDSMIRIGEKRPLSERLSSRLVLSASVLDASSFLGWQMTVPCKGMIGCTLFGSEEITDHDLNWIAEHTAAVARVRKTERLSAWNRLYELVLPAGMQTSSRSAIGFGADCTAHAAEPAAEWPVAFTTQFPEIVEALRLTGGAFRAVVGSADRAAQESCRSITRKTLPHNIDAADYIGTPVRMRMLLRLPAPPTIRLRAILHNVIPEAELREIGCMDTAEAAAVWDTPLTGAPVLPDYAARILMLEPQLTQPILGMKICPAPVRAIPAMHKNPAEKHAITLGRAIDTSGIHRKITLGELDLRRHYQIVGQTGTGKSTLLSTIILSAIEQGHGVTFFDPHGSTIQTILHALPAEYADRVRVVHIGDKDNPVPLNIWDSGDPEKEERNIADLCDLFANLFNSPGQLIVGPRYERWLSAFAKASIALMGKRASLESIAVLSQSRDNMKKVCERLAHDHPALRDLIYNEFVCDHSSDFNNLLGWLLSKFQRFTSVEQLRKTLGAGTNALDFRRTIDTDTVTLIDLATPEIGTQPARIVGTILMMKLWNAVLNRNDRNKTHLAVIDEASLFQTEPMPRMLAESRKFGLSLVLCHQHTGQLSEEIRDALEANSANFSAFKLSPRDAAHAAIRFDNGGMQTHLASMNAFRAVTTLSVNGTQTAPFTLETVPPKKQKNGDEIAAKIEAESIRKLVTPYRNQRALTPEEILEYLKPPTVTAEGDGKPHDADDVDYEIGLDEDDLYLSDFDDDPADDDSDTQPVQDPPRWLRKWNDNTGKKKQAG